MTNASELAIEVSQLRHSFGTHRALDGVSFQVPAGTIHGFVGPNGAGKTTTLKAVATLLTTDSGEVRVYGHDARREQQQIRRLIGWMPDHVAGYRRMTVGEYLDFFAAAYGLDRVRRERTVAEVLELTDMTARRGDQLSGLSRGMQQRVALSRVLVHDPKLLLLDEPASGLDPRARIELMEVLSELRRMGKTIFISSHILSELADMCDGVTVMDRGQAKYCGDLAGLLRRPTGDDGDAIELVLAEAVAGFAEAMATMPGVRACTADAQRPLHLTVTFDAATDSSGILRRALELGAKPRELRPALRRLDEAFMALTTPGVRS